MKWTFFIVFNLCVRACVCVNAYVRIYIYCLKALGLWKSDTDLELFLIYHPEVTLEMTLSWFLSLNISPGQGIKDIPRGPAWQLSSGGYRHRQSYPGYSPVSFPVILSCEQYPNIQQSYITVVTILRANESKPEAGLTVPQSPAFCCLQCYLW